jgi:hypothetical protein
MAGVNWFSHLKRRYFSTITPVGERSFLRSFLRFFPTLGVGDLFGEQLVELVVS